ncbi:MAG TPA: PEP-CTERM sorting domain-containing protein [Verrucomicrobiae bacterium]|nr:PEP-CTERM sorting domain-containing protein [Verrucomicrobiae bacterium]
MAHVFRSSVISICVVGLLICVTTRDARATIDAAVTISSQDAGGGAFNYTLTLNNHSTSTSPIETLWFSWIPGLDFMSVSPTAETAPTGWDTFVETGYYGGYSVRYTTTTAPLNPNGQLQFSFTSTVTSNELAGNDSVFGYYPELTTFLYSQSIEGGDSTSLLAQQVTAVPEPSSIALVGFGIVAAAFGIGCRRLRFRSRK